MKPIITFGAIYGGVGGPTLGAQMAGLSPSWVIEPRKYFNLKTHRYNFPNVPWSHQTKAFFADTVDVIWGSPSCGEFSSSGRSSKNQVKVETKAFEDFEYVNFVNELCKRKPTIFILENLPSIRNFLSFEATPAGMVLRHMISGQEISMPDYYIEEHRIVPTEVGIPQIRDRLFTIGSLFPHKFMLKPPTQDRRDEISIRHIFEDLDERRLAGENLLNDKFPKHTQEKIDLMARLKPGEAFYSGSAQKRLNPDKPAPVIMSSATKYIHPWENRTLTVRESACLMGYPMDFLLFGGENACLDMVGKGIVPQVAEFILTQVREYLEKVK